MPAEPNARPEPMFFGEHLAMDFLNSTATPSGERVEWLRDGADLVDWLERAGAIEAAVAAKFRRGSARKALDGVAEQARDLRGWLRAFVARYAGRGLGAEAAAELGPLNRLLASDDSFLQVEVGGEGGSGEPGAPGMERRGQRPLRLRKVRRWTAPEQLLQPIAEAIGDLVCHADFRLIRACEGAGCSLMFLDRTKSHARRWCSMALCGNRAKVAAHRARASGKRA